MSIIEIAFIVNFITLILFILFGIKVEKALEKALKIIAEKYREGFKDGKNYAIKEIRDNMTYRETYLSGYFEISVEEMKELTEQLKEK